MDAEEEINMLPSADNQPSVHCPGLPCESTSSCSQALFIPQVKNDLIPKLNQQFDCLDDVQQFYNNYAKEAGFGTRSSTSRKNRQYEIIRKEFCCAKQGVGVQTTTQDVTRVRGISKEGCGARVAVVKKAEKYVVTQFVEGHSHPFASPRRVHTEKLFKLASNVIDDAIVSEEATQFVEDVFCSTQKKVLDIRGVGEVGEGSAMQVPRVHDHGIKEPLPVRAKGCGKRMKGGKEKMVKKARRCHGCGLTGQSHDKRNCPALINVSSQSAWSNDEGVDDDADEDDE